jgi:hypothetical protein
MLVARSSIKSCGYDGTIERRFFIVCIFVTGAVGSWCS